MSNRATPIIAAIVFPALGLFAGAQPALAQEAASTDELVVIDLRPKEEREGNGLAPLEGKCNKGVFRVADVASDPLKLDVLKDDVVPMFRMTGQRRTLTVLNWSIYYNTQAGKGDGPSVKSVGIQGYAIPGRKTEKQQGSKCSRAESAGGWYAAGDVTTRYPPLVSELTGTFAGKPVTVRVVHSPRRKITGKFEGAADDTEELIATAHETAEALATAIGR